jgi:hypothetical protein
MDGGEARVRQRGTDSGAWWAADGCVRVRQRGTDTWARQHNATRFSFLNRIKFISNGFKILQILTDPKGAFPCTKNWK